MIAADQVRAHVEADWTLRGHYRLCREQPPLDPARPRTFRWRIVGALDYYAAYHTAYWRGRAGQPPANDWPERYDTAAWLAGVDDQALRPVGRLAALEQGRQPGDVGGDAAGQVLAQPR